MIVILPHAHFEADHLASVIAEMAVLGAPTIKAIDCGDHYVALEGSHRLRAAHTLGIEPIFNLIDYVAEAETDDVAPGSYQDNYTLEEIVAASSRSEPMEF